jgi:hypothetical protein
VENLSQFQWFAPPATKLRRPAVTTSTRFGNVI